MLIEMLRIQQIMIETHQQGQQFDASLKERILRAAKQSYENVRNSWAGQECFSCALMHDFFQSLVHIHSPQLTAMLKEKIGQHFERRNTPNDCLNQQCFGLDSKQWKSKQSSGVLGVLEPVLDMMMEVSCRSGKAAERQDALLDIEYELNCSCSKCKASGCLSERAISSNNESQQVDYNSLKVIEQCLKSPNAQRVHESARIDRIFDLLKEDRKHKMEQKQAIKQRHDLLFSLYGNLLGLQKERTEEAALESLQRRKQRIYDELFKRNNNNQRFIRRFSRKASLLKSQNKIARLHSIELPPTPTKHKSTTKDNLTASTPISSSRLLNRISSRGSARRQLLEPIGSIQDCVQHYQRMQERVDRALKNYEPREEKRTSILKSVVLNASDMFTQRKMSKQSDRPFYTRLDRTARCIRGGSDKAVPPPFIKS